MISFLSFFSFFFADPLSLPTASVRDTEDIADEPVAGAAPL